jgi:hypothetical protein
VLTLHTHTHTHTHIHTHTHRHTHTHTRLLRFDETEVSAYTSHSQMWVYEKGAVVSSK